MNISTLTNKGTIEIELKEKFYIGFLLYILKLILDQVWTTSVWTGLIPTGTDRFETESNRTDTIGPVRSICISRTDRFGPSQLFGPIGPVQMQARTEDRPIWTDMQIIHIKDGM